jgi:hypothetical protein
MMTNNAFEGLKMQFGGKIIDLDQADEIEEAECVEVTNNGLSGRFPNCDYFTARQIDTNGDYVGHEFDFYMNRY